MIPRQWLASAHIPGTPHDELRLFSHGNDFIIMLGNNELMNSRVYGSEEALAHLSCNAIAEHIAPHILIGGYGMGFTLRAALASLPKEAVVTIIELVPAIIDWARGPMQSLGGTCLNDPRVNLEIDDVADTIKAAKNRYHAILLDVDNGPNGLTKDDNDSLYSDAGLNAAKAALVKGGILAIWSAHSDTCFTKRLKNQSFRVNEHRVKARSNGKGAQHHIWLAQKLE